MRLGTVVVNGNQLEVSYESANPGLTFNVDLTAGEEGEFEHFEAGKARVSPKGGFKKAMIDLKPFDYTRPGTYQLLVKVMSGNSVITQKLVEVRVPVPERSADKPFVERYVDSGKKNSVVYLQVFNPTAELKKVKVREEIPKSAASHVSQVTFTLAPTVIINPDPVVEWELELKPGEVRELSYSVGNSTRSVTFSPPSVLSSGIAIAQPEQPATGNRTGAGVTGFAIAGVPGATVVATSVVLLVAVGGLFYYFRLRKRGNEGE